MNIRSTFYISVLVFILIFISGTIKAQTCPQDFTVKTVTTPSTCESNGTVKVTLEGDIENLFDIQYGLTSPSTGFTINPQSSSLLENVPAGTYNISVRAFCRVDQSYDVVKIQTGVVVEGNYKVPAVSFNATTSRKSYDYCNTGIIALDVVNGSGNFTFTIVSAPDGVMLGEVVLTKSGNTYTFPTADYPAGTYKVLVSDGCYTAAASFELGEISKFPSVSTAGFSAFRPTFTDNDCGKVHWRIGNVQSSNPDYYRYYTDGMYEVGVAPIGETPTNWIAWTPQNIIKNYELPLDISPYSIADFYPTNATKPENTISLFMRLKGCNDSLQSFPAYIKRPTLGSNNTNYGCDSYIMKLYPWTDYDGMLCYPLTVIANKASDDTEVFRQEGWSYSTSGVSVPLLEYDTLYNYTIIDSHGTIVKNSGMKKERQHLYFGNKQECEGYKLTYYARLNCYPVYVEIVDKKTENVVYRDTLVNSNTKTAPDYLEYGVDYIIRETYPSAIPEYEYTREYKLNSSFPIKYNLLLSISNSDRCYENRAALYVSTGGSGYPPIGTVITITGPEGYTSQSIKVSSNTSSYYFNTTYLPPGEYTATIDHGCGTPLTAVLSLKGVYNGKALHHTAEKTCEGLKVYPKGAMTLRGDSIKTYYRLVSGPTGYDKTVRTSGGSFILTSFGTYVLGILSQNDATACVLHRDTIRYEPVPMSLSAHETQAYVCVESTVGVMLLKAINGVTPYTYELWNKDNTVKLIDESITSSNRVRFNYGEADSTYTVRVTDICGNSFSQRITLARLSTMRIVYSPQPNVCWGDTVRLSCITLGETKYNWSGPNGFTSTDQHPRIPDARVNMSGWYKVSILPEFCGSAIQDSVYINVREPLVSSSTGSDQRVCVGSAIAELSSTTTGGSGTYSYQWQISEDTATWTDINAATEAAYTPVLAEAGFYYFRRATIDECGTIYSDTITIQVDAMPVADAGPDLAQHKNHVFTLGATAPSIGSGSWSIVQGNVVVASPSLPTSEVTVDANETLVVLAWTVTNTTCEASDTVRLYTRNYWYGGTGTTGSDWNTPSNWTSGIVPGEHEDIEFATNDNNGTSGGGNGLGEAVSDLAVPATGNILIGNLINASSKNLIIPASGSLTVEKAITITNPTTGNTPSTDANKIQIKAEAGKPNGTLIVNCDEQRTAQPDVYVTVDLYGKGFEDTETEWVDDIPGSPTIGQTFKSSFHWQYVGIPVASVKADPTFHASSIRQYFEDYNGDNSTYYKKWKDIKNYDILEAFKGYEITQRTPATYAIAGKLVYCNQSLTMTRKAPAITGASGHNVHYGLGQNIFGNSYTSSIDVSKITFPNEVEKTVYLYNTGRFTDWGEANTNPNDGSALVAGQYTAIPQLTAEAVYDGAIPSMNGFLVKFLQAETVYGGADVNLTLPYSNDGVRPNSRPQTVGRDKLSYLQVRLLSPSTVDHLWLFSHEGTTNGFDNGWDGRKFFGTPTAYIYTETKDGLMQVSANKTIDGSTISFYANEDKEYELTLTKSNLDQYSDLHLVDLKDRTATPLNGETTVYRFKAENWGQAEKRFRIINSSQIDFDSEDFKLLNGYVKGKNSLVLTNYTGQEGRVNLYDMTGRSLLSEVLHPGVEENHIMLRSGIYILYMEADGIQESIKVIIQ